MKINGFDHVEYYVGDLTAAVAALRDGYGFGVAGRSSAAPISSRIRAAPTVSGGDSL